MDGSPSTIDTIQNGVFLGKHRKRYILPEAFTTLFDNTETNSSPSLQLFHKYATKISQVCAPNTKQNNQTKEFISNSSLHKCHDAINTEIKHRLKTDILLSLEDDSKHNAEEILDGKLGQGLLDLPRSNENNRQHNRLFRFNLLQHYASTYGKVTSNSNARNATKTSTRKATTSTNAQ